MNHLAENKGYVVLYPQITRHTIAGLLALVSP